MTAQERAFYKYCEAQQDCTTGKVYREEGKSAHVDTIRKRPVFKRLLEDAARGEFDVVVVHTLDRWSRNQMVLLESQAILARNNVTLVSITEPIDWSTPMGKWMGRSVGNNSELYSDMLSVHVEKGITGRIDKGLHLGTIPFGYESCWTRVGGERRRICNPEHPGGVHIHAEEGPAVQELYRRYAAGHSTCPILASWLNGEGFLTKNTKNLPDGAGNLSAGPRLFTLASVRGILHNHFYTGQVKHRCVLLPGIHEPLISTSLFDTVQTCLTKNSGRSRTLNPRPEREYLLKGLIRCGHCGLPMWAQTYNNGNRYYREHRGSRGAGYCVDRSRSLPCHVPDGQMGRIIESILLPKSYMDLVLAQIQLADEVKRVERERKRVEERIRRLREVYLEGDLPRDQYGERKRNLENQLASLVIPDVDAAKEAGKLLEQLPALWEEADLSERRQLLTAMLEAVYVDTVEERAIVALKPKPAFRALFQIATTREGSGVILYKENPPDQFPSPEDNSPCSWWRRGRVELPVQTRYSSDRAKTKIEQLHKNHRLCIAERTGLGDCDYWN